MSEEMRKEFEEWFISTGHNRSALNRNEFYVEVMVEEMWLAWRASREAMEPIKLPVKMKNTEAAECYYYNDAIDECKEAIEQAGYKVTP